MRWVEMAESQRGAKEKNAPRCIGKRRERKGAGQMGGGAHSTVES